MHIDHQSSICQAGLWSYVSVSVTDIESTEEEEWETSMLELLAQLMSVAQQSYAKKIASLP